MRILVVTESDDAATRLRASLQRRGGVVDNVGSLERARVALQIHQYRALLVEWRFPDRRVISLVVEMRRRQPGLAIMLLCSPLGVPDVVEGLQAGADDYLAGHYEHAEMLARLRAVTRRQLPVAVQRLDIGRLRFEFGSGVVLLDGQKLYLPRKQLKLLEALCARSGQRVRRSVLESAVYGEGRQVPRGGLDCHVSKLRRALAPAEIRIQYARGHGYLLLADRANGGVQTDESHVNLG